MYLKRYGLAVLAACFLLPAAAFAQNFTSVSGTITDPNGLPYSYATVQAQLVPTGGNPTINGQAVSSFTQAAADVTGTFSMTLGSNAVILPAATQWQFTVNIAPGIPAPLGTGPQSFVSTITISGASQSISVTLSAAAPKLSNFIGAGIGTIGGTVSATHLTFASAADTISDVLGSAVTAGTGAIALTATGTGITPISLLPFSSSQTAPLFLIGKFSAATALSNSDSGILKFDASYWDGSAAQDASFTIQRQVAAGTNPNMGTYFTNTGYGGGGSFIFNGAISSGGSISAATAIDAGTDLIVYGNTPATAGGNINFGALKLDGNYWDGAASQVDDWRLTPFLGAGTNPTSKLTLTHSGTPGAISFNFGAGIPVNWLGSTSGSAGITVAAVAGTPAPVCLPTATAAVAGYVLSSDGGTSPCQQLSWVAQTGGGPGTGTQYAPAYWATTSTLGSATPGTTNGDYILTEHVTGGAAVAPTLVQAGLGGRAITGATSTDAPTYADNETCVVHDQAASAGVTYTLPTTTTLGNTNFVLCIQNHSANTDTLKATTFTIQSGKTAAVAGATGISIPAGSSLRVKVDPNLSTQWLVDFNSTGSPVWQGCGSRGLGDGLNAMTAGTYLQFTCVNDTGATVTITGIHCWTDNAGTSTLNAANNAATALLTGAVTCNNTKASGGASGTQSGTTTLASGDAISFTFVADGTSKQTNWTVSGTY